MNNLKIGLASVTFRKKSVQEVVKIAKENNVEFIEWGGDVHVKNSSEAETAKKLCDEAGVKISSYGSYYRVGSNKHEEWKEICLIAHKLSAPSIRVWLGVENSEDTTEEEYLDLLEDAKFMCDVAAEYNLLICPECHDNTFNNNTYAFLKFAEDLQRENFRTYFQSRYTKFEYDLDRIDKTFEFIENVHVSYRDLFREQLFAKKDRKYIDKLINKLISKNFDGIVMIEFTKADSEKHFSNDVRKLREI
ncbi:MAG: sugar phosphate isomerase/epimerase [Ruminococcaceae bacterium]|nr:sugar phosphate isomerase/epimerase [Oscillospiraceae bacterium]